MNVVVVSTAAADSLGLKKIFPERMSDALMTSFGAIACSLFPILRMRVPEDADVVLVILMALSSS